MDNYGIQHSGRGDINNSGAVGPGATVNFNHTPPPETSSTDVGVITVLSEELTAVVEVLRRGIGYRQHSDAAGRVVHEALVPLNSTGDIRVAALQTTDRGQRPAGHAFEYLR